MAEGRGSALRGAGSLASRLGGGLWRPTLGPAARLAGGAWRCFGGETLASLRWLDLRRPTDATTELREKPSLDLKARGWWICGEGGARRAKLAATGDGRRGGFHDHGGGIMAKAA